MAQESQKAALIAELANARSRIALHWNGFRQDLDFSACVKRAFALHPAPWIGGAAFLGLLIAKLKTRKKKIVIGRKGKDTAVETAGKAGLMLGALKIVADLARPVVTAWVARRISDYSTGKWKTGSPRS